MKKYWLLFLLMPFLFAASPTQRGYRSVLGANTETCSATTRLFVWHLENATDITIGNPGGCSVGDTTPSAFAISLTGTKKFDGRYSGYSTTNASVYRFQGTSEDIAHFDEGKIKIRCWVETHLDGSQILRMTGNADSANNNMYIAMETTGGTMIKAGWNGNASGVQITSTVAISTSQWITITYAWKNSLTTQDQYLGVDNDNDGVDDASTQGTDISDWAAGDKADFDLDIGNASGVAGAVYIDWVEVYDASGLI